MFNDLKQKLENIPSSYYIIGGVAFIAIVWFFTRSSGGQIASGTTPSQNLNTALGQLSDAVDQVTAGGGGGGGGGSTSNGGTQQIPGQSAGGNTITQLQGNGTGPVQPLGNPSTSPSPSTNFYPSRLGSAPSGTGGYIVASSGQFAEWIKDATGHFHMVERNTGGFSAYISKPFTARTTTGGLATFAEILSGSYKGQFIHVYGGPDANPVVHLAPSPTVPVSNSPYEARVLIPGANNVLPRVQTVSMPKVLSAPATTTQIATR